MAIKKARYSETERFIESGMKKKVFGTFCRTNIRSSKKRKKVLEDFISLKSAVSEAYSDPNRTSKMELFARIANGFQPLTIS